MKPALKTVALIKNKTTKRSHSRGKICYSAQSRDTKRILDDYAFIISSTFLRMFAAIYFIHR
jgi:hypothetical protein